MYYKRAYYNKGTIRNTHSVVCVWSNIWYISILHLLSPLRCTQDDLFTLSFYLTEDTLSSIAKTMSAWMGTSFFVTFLCGSVSNMILIEQHHLVFVALYSIQLIRLIYVGDRQDTAHVLLCEFWGWNHQGKRRKGQLLFCVKISFFEEG